MRKYALLLAAIPLLFIAGEVGAAGEVWESNPTIQRGKRTVAATGEIELVSGATLDAQSGATVILQGLTFSATELGALDGITLGNSQNSKVWTANSTGKLILVNGDSLNIAAGSIWQIGSTTVTSSATEINYLDITTLGSSENSKALTVAATGEATIVSGDSLNIIGIWQINSVPVTPTAAELNYNDIATLGSSENSKVLTAAATGKITIIAGDSLNVIGPFLINSVAVAATAAELNYTDVGTLGTTEASKAVTANADQDIRTASGDSIFVVSGAVVSVATGGAIDLTASTLKIANTAVTASAAELNYTDVTTVGVSQDSKAVTLTSAGKLDGGNIVLVVEDSLDDVSIDAGKTILAGVAGKTIRVRDVAFELVGPDSLTGDTSLLLTDTAGSPVTVATISGAALLCASGRTVTSTMGAGATMAYGAGWGVGLTADAGLKVVGAGGTAAFGATAGYYRVRVYYTVDQ